MAGFEEVARGPEVDVVACRPGPGSSGSALRWTRDSARERCRRSGSARSPTGSTSAIMRREIGVDGARDGVELDADVARDLDVSLERRRREDEHVVRDSFGPLIEGARAASPHRNTAGRRSCARGSRDRSRRMPATPRCGGSTVRAAVARAGVRRPPRPAGSTSCSSCAASGNSCSSRQTLSPITKSRTGAPVAKSLLLPLSAKSNHSSGRGVRRRARPSSPKITSPILPSARRRRVAPRAHQQTLAVTRLGGRRLLPQAAGSSRSSPAGRGRASRRRAAP